MYRRNKHLRQQLILLLLLPLAIVTLTAPFVHTCATEDELSPHADHVGCAAANPGVPFLTSNHPPASHHDECYACTWTRDGVSSICEPAACRTSVIANPPAPQPASDLISVPVTLHLTRAPPAG